MKAVLLSGRWAGRTRRLGLEQAAKASADGAEVQAENVMLRDTIELLVERLACAERRLKAAHIRTPNAGWVEEALEEAFLCHGAPKHLISDQEGVFTSEVFRDLLWRWDVKQRFGAVGRHGSIAVTERLIWTLKHEWLARVPLIRGLDHLGELLADFEVYYNQHRCHQRLGGATPSMIYAGGNWQKPDRSAKTLRCPIRLRHFREERITVYELAA